VEHYDPTSHLQHWGGSVESLSGCGLNPFGENIWRIVYAPSRRSLVRQSAKRHIWMRTYPQAGVAWVLEKWKSAFEFAGPRERWESSGIGVLGDYPSRGEYELAHIFYPAPASIGHVKQMITLTEAGPAKFSANENKNAIRAELDRQKVSEQKYWHDRLMERTHAFGTAPFSASGGSRGTKTREFKIAAQDTGLPGPGHLVTRQGTKRYDVSELIAK
jgi:hypothetical protein